MKTSSGWPLRIIFTLWIAASLGLWFASSGRLLQMVVPAGATLVGFLLMRRSPAQYTSFVLWLWFVIPLVRRLADWRCGWSDPNFILLAPLLATAVCGLDFVLPQRTPMPTRNILFPLLLCGGGVLYGLVIGLFLHPFGTGEVIYGLFNWGSPLLLALYVMRHADRYGAIRSEIIKTFLLGTIGLSLYGLYQFIIAPAWDSFWLTNITQGLIDPSFGNPEPFGMRVWSTMNSAGPFANMVIAGLLLALCSNRRWRYAAIALGVVAMLITSVRTAWLSCAIGLAALATRVSLRQAMRGIVVILAVLLLALPLTQLPFIQPMVHDRLQTFNNLSRDESFNERTDMYRRLLRQATEQPFGHGLRNQEVIGNTVVDSGLLTTLFSLGWFGATSYLAGVLVLMFRRRPRDADDLFPQASVAISWAFLAQLVGSNLFVGSTGIFFWLLNAMSLLHAQRVQQGKVVHNIATAPTYTLEHAG